MMNKLTYKKRIFASFLIIFLLTPLSPQEIFSAAEIERIPLNKIETKSKNYKEGEVLVKYKNKEKFNQKLEKINQGKENRNLATIRKEIKGTKIAVLQSENRTTADLLDELKNDENIELAEPNYARRLAYVSNDPYFDPYQWAHQNTGQTIYGTIGTLDADADIVEAWDIEESDASETIVAVIDTGVRHSHADLANNMWDGTVCVDEDNLPIIGGCPNHGWDFADGDNDPDDTTSADQGHGTSVASVIASETGNASGIAGLSRYNNLKIMALRFDLWMDTEIETIYFAKYNGAKIINASFVGDYASIFERIAIEDFGGIFVAAAGNGGSDLIGDNNDTAPQYPCSHSSANIICVAASDQNDALAGFSNFGSSSVDLAAPGTDIISYTNGYAGWDYYLSDGTSLAAPFVAGAAAFLHRTYPNLSTSEIKSRLLSSGDSLSVLSGKTVSGKRLNLKNSMLPILTEISPVPLFTTDTTPEYTFHSTHAGNLSYSGACSSNTTSASQGNNIITFDPLPIGTYADCSITLTTDAEGQSLPLAASSFTISQFEPDMIGVLSSGAWYLDMNFNGIWNGSSIDRNYSNFGKGLSDVMPVTGDWNGDGTTDIGVFSNGSWYLDMNNNGVWDGASTDRNFSNFGKGLASVQSITGDWNGDGTTDIGVFSNGSWYLDMNNNGVWDGASTDRNFANFGKGLSNVMPVAGDWDGDGTTDIGVFSNGSWYLDMNNNGTWNGTEVDRNYSNFGKGLSGALPVSGDWDGSGTSKIGVFIPSSGQWYLDANGNGAYATNTDTYVANFGRGLTGALPISGNW